METGYSLEEIIYVVKECVPTGYNEQLIECCNYIFSNKKVSPLTLTMETNSLRQLASIIFKLKQSRDSELLEEFVEKTREIYNKQKIDTDMSTYVNKIIDMNKKYDLEINKLREFIEKLGPTERTMDTVFFTVMSSRVTQEFIDKIIRDAMEMNKMKNEMIEYYNNKCQPDAEKKI